MVQWVKNLPGKHEDSLPPDVMGTPDDTNAMSLHCHLVKQVSQLAWNRSSREGGVYILTMYQHRSMEV